MRVKGEEGRLGEVNEDTEIDNSWEIFPKGEKYCEKTATGNSL